jgi:hypothetical protein
MITERGVKQITLSVAGLSPWRLTFKFRPVQMGFVALLSGSSLHVILPVSFYEDNTRINSSTTAAVPS